MRKLVLPKAKGLFNKSTNIRVGNPSFRFHLWPEVIETEFKFNKSVPIKIFVFPVNTLLYHYIMIYWNVGTCSLQ